MVPLIAPNGLNLLPWMAALATLGIPVTGLDYTLPSETLHNLVGQLGAELLLVSGTAREWNSDALDFGPTSAIRVDLDSITLAHLNATIEPPEHDLLEPPKGSFRSVGLTSGTSGAPKVVVRTTSFDQRRFRYFTERYGFGQQDRFLVSMPLYHAAGNGWARMFMSLGATIYLAPINSPIELATALRAHEITATVMTPSSLNMVIDALGTPDKTHRLPLRWVLVGGKHFPVPQKMRAIKRLGKVVYEYYGTTETGVNTIAEPNDLLLAPASVGKPIDGNSIAIFDKNGTRVESGTVGSVAVASYMNMDNYDDGSSNSLIIDGERYLITPDQGYLDPEGRLFLMNRSAEPGNSTPLYRLEDEIRGLPCVADVALLQREDSKIDCALVLRNNMSETNDISDRVRCLASNECLPIEACRYVPVIPYSPTGKIRIPALTSYFTNP